VDIVEQLLYRPADAAKVLGLSRSFIYERIADGSLESLRCGGARLIPADALQSWIERLRTTHQHDERGTGLHGS
jgi:excisionase family DNA binding protein